MTAGAMPTSPGWWWVESPKAAGRLEPALVQRLSAGPEFSARLFGHIWAPASNYSWRGRCVSAAGAPPVSEAIDEPAVYKLRKAEGSAVDRLHSADYGSGYSAVMHGDARDPTKPPGWLAGWDAATAHATDTILDVCNEGESRDALLNSLDRPAIYSVRQAIAETDLPADTSSSDAIRELWGRVELAKAGIALGIDVTEQLQAKLNKAEASERARADAASADKPEPTAHRTHQDVVDALRGLIVFEAEHDTGRDDAAADLTGLAALVTAYTGTDPRESSEMADRVEFAVTVCEQPEGLGRAVLEAVGRP